MTLAVDVLQADGPWLRLARAYVMTDAAGRLPPVRAPGVAARSGRARSRYRAAVAPDARNTHGGPARVATNSSMRGSKATGWW